MCECVNEYMWTQPTRTSEYSFLAWLAEPHSVHTDVGVARATRLSNVCGDDDNDDNNNNYYYYYQYKGQTHGEAQEEEEEDEEEEDEAEEEQ